MSKKIVCVFVIVCCALFSLAAQQTGQTEDRGRTIEDVYLSQNLELRLIRNLATSSDWEERSLAIQNLRDMLEDHRLDENNSGAMMILEEMAKPIEQGGNTRNFNIIRKDAVNILGSVGGKRSKQILMEVLTADRDSLVRAEAVHALGKVGIDEKGEVLTLIMDMLHKENVKPTPNDNLANAALLAIEKLAKSTGGLKAVDQLDPLNEMLHRNYNQAVKRKCLEVINALLH
ncbi:MAG: HEAT repeat domain-containing protein [Spirochaetia bacterium]|jgi:HEAT repeat protein|nr:HEAT repeat domain-containing protein [Spirochaetia bacterium]